MNTPLVSLVIVAFASSVGCARIGNFFVPPHPNSDQVGLSKECLYLTGEEIQKRPAGPGLLVIPPLAGIAAAAAIGFLVDRTAAAIKDESTRYQASYSARQTKNLIYVQPDDGENAYLWHTLKFVRYLGKDNTIRTKTCDQLEGDNTFVKAITLEAELKKPPEITITKVTLNKTKAKVASVRWYVPWSWWMWLDRSAETVDLKATVTLSTIVKPVNGPPQSKDIVSADLPLGKHELTDTGGDLPITDVSSGPFVIPKAECGSDCVDLNTTATVTMTESNELGDIIGNAAKKVTDNKQSIVNFVLNKLNINPPQEDSQQGNASGGSTSANTPNK